MGHYGKGLPVTGLAVLTIGGAQITTPWLALAGGAVVVAGFLLMRLVRPLKTHTPH